MKTPQMAVTAPEGYEIISDTPLRRNRRTWGCRPREKQIALWAEETTAADLPVEGNGTRRNRAQ